MKTKVRTDLNIPPPQPGDYDYAHPPGHTGRPGRPPKPDPLPDPGPGEPGQPDPEPIVQPPNARKYRRRRPLKLSTTTGPASPCGPPTLSERMTPRRGPGRPRLAEVEPLLDGAPLPRIRLQPRHYEETIVGEIVAWLRRLRYMRQRNGAPRSVKTIIEAFEILDRMARQALGISQGVSPSQLNINVVGSRMSQPFEPVLPPKAPRQLAAPLATTLNTTP